MSSKLSNMKFMKGSTAIVKHEQNKATAAPMTSPTPTQSTSAIFEEDPTDSELPRFVQLNSSSSKDSSRLYTEQIGKDMNVGADSSVQGMFTELQHKFCQFKYCFEYSPSSVRPLMY